MEYHFAIGNLFVAISLPAISHVIPRDPLPIKSWTFDWNYLRFGDGVLIRIFELL